MNTNNPAIPLTLFDPMVDDAANRLFGKLGPEARLAADRGEPDEALRAAISEAGFCEALGGLDARDDWPAAAAILRAQARHGAPIDMADELLANALAGEPDDAASAEATEGRRQRAMTLSRCIQAGGAMQAALDLSIRYVSDRKQFGQALARFQAIQHSLAVTAEIVAAAASATNFALACVIEEGIDSDRSAAAIDAATVVACDAIRSVHENCHQVHGAIGFTIEYGLHRHTLDLLRWRDDLEACTGGPMRCAERLGAAVVTEGGLWLAVTDLQRLTPRAS
jgi:acyl-CoA dehydrogenase